MAILSEVFIMLRFHAPQFLWVIVWFLLALFLLGVEAMLFPQAAIAIMTFIRESVTPFFLGILS
jgi:hypothetical protein